jgi:hypothetical protein
LRSDRLFIAMRNPERGGLTSIKLIADNALDRQRRGPTETLPLAVRVNLGSADHGRAVLL